MSRSYKRLTKEAKKKLKAQVKSKRTTNKPSKYEEIDDE